MYYIIINGQQAGPFAREELLRHGLTPQSMVWRQGMADWMPASSVEELNKLFFVRQMPEHDNATRIISEHQKPYATSNSYQQPQQQWQQQQSQQQWQQPQQPQQPWQQQPMQQPLQQTNWMPWAIVATVLGLCSCIGLVLGIIGIVNASKANNAFAIGDWMRGDQANKTARTCTIIALCFDGLGIIGSCMYIPTLGAL